MGTEGIQDKYINLFEAAEIAKFTRTERSEYWDSLKNFRDLYSVISTAESKGRKKGREEGREEERIKNAVRMKQKGYPLEDIVEITGLSIEEIRGV